MSNAPLKHRKTKLLAGFKGRGWVRSVAMVAVAGVALTGVTVLQALNSPRGAAASSLQVDAAVSELKVSPAPETNPQPVGGVGAYHSEVLALGWDTRIGQVG
ncbi:MAG: hypothetical protein LBO75_02265, partial [Bifidobacteriaceae bacterium]|nr:hypothetical protein [Bifidobacteriaceae bacterium]